MFDRSFRLYILGLAIGFPFFYRLRDFFYILFRRNHRFVIFTGLLFIFNILTILLFILRKNKHSESLPFISAFFILHCAFSLHKLFIVQQNMNNRAGFFKSYFKNIQRQFFKSVNIFPYSVESAKNEKIVYQRSLGNFPIRLMKEYERKKENENIYNQEIENLNEERNQFYKAFTSFTDKYNLFIRNSLIINNELSAIDIPINSLRNNFTQLNTSAKNISCFKFPLFSNQNLLSNTDNSIRTNNVSGNTKGFEIKNYLFTFQIIFLLEILIAFSIFVFEQKELSILEMIRTGLFIFTIFNSVVMIYIFIFTQMVDQQCLMRNISECKNIDSSYDHLNNIIFPNSNRLGGANEIENEFRKISKEQKNIIENIKSYVNLIMKNTIETNLIAFTELFKKFLYIEKDFNRLMESKIDKEAYYFLLKEMNGNLEQMKIFNRSVKNHDLLPLLDRFYKSMSFYDIEQNNINTYISKNIVSERGVSVNEGCRVYLDRICRSADMLDKVYFTLLICGSITGIVLSI